MVLKEAFTYMNYLTKMISEAQLKLTLPDSPAFKKARKHFISKADDTKGDFEEDLTPKSPFSGKGEQLISAVDELIREHTACAAAISVAKHKMDFDLDAIIAENKVLNSAVHMYGYLSNAEAEESMDTAIDYRFNNEGNQTAFRYPVKDVRTITYDRKKIKQRHKALKQLISDNSLKVDRAMLTVEVDFTPRWDITDSLEEIALS